MLKLDLRFRIYVKIIFINNLCIETGQENVKSWEISRPFELEEPDFNDLGVNEPWKWKQARQCSMRVKCSKFICREMEDFSVDIVKNHCVNVLIKLNLPQCVLYKTCLRNLFFWKFKLRRSILFKLGWVQYRQIGFYYLRLSLNIGRSEKSKVRYNPNLVSLKFWF